MKDQTYTIEEVSKLVAQIKTLEKERAAIEDKAVEIISGYGNTGKSTFSTPIAVMCRMRDEIDLLRDQLKKADAAFDENITTFLDLREEIAKLEAELQEARNLARYYQEQLGHANQEHEWQELPWEERSES